MNFKGREDQRWKTDSTIFKSNTNFITTLERNKRILLCIKQNNNTSFFHRSRYSVSTVEGLKRLKKQKKTEYFNRTTITLPQKSQVNLCWLYGKTKTKDCLIQCCNTWKRRKKKTNNKHRHTYVSTLTETYKQHINFPWRTSCHCILKRKKERLHKRHKR